MTPISAPNQGIAVSSARSLHDDLKVKVIETSEANSKIPDIRHMHEPQSPEERNAQIAKQRSDKVHTVFRSGGKVVAILGNERGITSVNGLGLVDMSGSKDQIAERIKERLSTLYGNVEVQQYPKGTNVTYGAVEDEMFGRGPRVPPPEIASKSSDTSSFAFAKTRTNFSAEMLEMLQKRWGA